MGASRNVSYWRKAAEARWSAIGPNRTKGLDATQSATPCQGARQIMLFFHPYGP
jgi:hypothetical protein